MAPPQVQVVVEQICAKVPGGTGRYTSGLVRALWASQPPGASLAAVLGRLCAATGELPVPVRRLGLPRVALTLLWERGLPPYAARRGVVHAPTLTVPPARAGCRLVVTVHDVVPWTHPETLTARGVRSHHRMGARAARDADLIVTPTRAVADQVRRLLHPSCPVVPVYPGVAPPLEVHTKNTPDAGRPYVLFVGTAEPRKGLDVLVRALAMPALSGIRLVVVGPPGWGGVSVAQLAEAAGVEDRVEATGFASDTELEQWYAGASALAMPSLAEGFGLPVVEAMARGVPVVVSADPALVEVGGDAVGVVPIGDPHALALALACVVEAGGDRDRARTAGIARAAGFTWEATADAMWQLYARVGAD